MKNIIFVCIIFLSIQCSKKTDELVTQKKDSLSFEYRDYTSKFTVNDFIATRNFVLAKGNKHIFTSLYLNNPHFAFRGCDVYLIPEIGTENKNCDTTISDFNQMLVRNLVFSKDYVFLAIRKGDLSNKAIIPKVKDWMKEEHFYLINPYFENIDTLAHAAAGYLETIKYTLKENNHIAP